MRITAIKRLERAEMTSAKPILELTIDEVRGIENVQVRVIHMHTFENGWALFLIDGLAAIEANMILADRDGAISISQGQPEFTLKPQECADCIAAKKTAYSDATTSGFFRPYCSKHAPKEKPRA